MLIISIIVIIIIRFGTAESQRLNRCRISVGYWEKTSRMCSGNVVADLVVQFPSNTIRLIRLVTAEMRRMNQA